MKLIIALIAISLAACGGTAKVEEKTATAKKEKSEWDKLIEDYKRDTASQKYFRIDPDHFDTTNIKESPVKVLGHRFVSYPRTFVESIVDSTIVFKVQNVSEKTIEAVRLRFYCENEFREPQFLYFEGSRWDFGSAEHRTPIKSGAIAEIETEKMSSADVIIVSAWASEVAFAGGDQWKVFAEKK